MKLHPLGLALICAVMFLGPVAACGPAKCSATTCVGCCDASGLCQPPTQLACGLSGSACQTCLLGTSCVNGFCGGSTGGGGGGTGGGGGGTGGGGGSTGGGGGSTGGGGGSTGGGGGSTGGGGEPRAAAAARGPRCFAPTTCCSPARRPPRRASSPASCRERSAAIGHRRSVGLDDHRGPAFLAVERAMNLRIGDAPIVRWDEAIEGHPSPRSSGPGTK